MAARASVSPVNLLVRGGYVLTMDSLGDPAGADVHVRDGVAPGLVDTHWHMWNTLLRGMSDGRPAPGGHSARGGTDRAGYFATCADVELVVADGRILKRDGVVTAFDIPTWSARPAVPWRACCPGRAADSRGVARSPRV